ncbi:SCO family protein [Oceanobacillus halophilus]|uniref:SCO family protein n=1 Tax=Oceanobacillus halophilus TaxID=930130 RepID=A0A495A4S6_9BACI|nr:SCO family protein [Oceanobacillus halophilus]RKQ34677.1 SCO family protein [Oceanobacillus halophilus]
MRKNWRNKVAILLSVFAGLLLLYIGTDGFRAFTAESARTYQLMKEKPVFPEVTLEDSNNRIYPFSDFEGKYVMLTFIYTACADVCPKLGMNLAEVYEQVPSEFIGENIVFLSISFDPKRDDPATLDKYRTYFGSDGETWRMARIPDQTELDRLLEEFGVIVIPDDYGNFTHNSAFYLVDKNGVLQEVMDYTKIDKAADTVISMVEEEAGD